MFRMPNANARGERQAGDSSGAVSGPGVWTDAECRRPVAAAHQKAGYEMIEQATIRGVTVQLFARLRELQASATVAVPLTEGSTVADLRSAIDILWRGEMRSLAQKSAVAVNGEYAAAELAIGPGDEVALIPPVSGG